MRYSKLDENDIERSLIGYNHELLKYIPKSVINEKYPMDAIEDLQSIEDDRELLTLAYSFDPFPIDHEMIELCRPIKKNGRILIENQDMKDLSSSIRGENPHVIYGKVNTIRSSRKHGVGFAISFLAKNCHNWGWVYHTNFDEYNSDNRNGVSIYIPGSTRNIQLFSENQILNRNQIPDILIKIVIAGYIWEFFGESKFCSCSGGSQSNQIDKALAYADHRNGFALIDGFPHRSNLLGHKNKFAKAVDHPNAWSIFDAHIMVQTMINERCI